MISPLLIATGAAMLTTVAPAPTALPLDAETQVGGVVAACTGIGQTKKDPHWLAFPVRIEVSDAANTYLADQDLTVRTSAGKVLLHVTCEGPWVLLKLPAGAYRAEARLQGSAAKARSARFTVSGAGQQRVVLQFPDAEPRPQPPGV